MQDCLRILSGQGESHLDAILVAQVKCQLISHQAEPFALMQPSLEGSQETPSACLITVLLRQLSEVRDRFPEIVKSESKLNIS